MCISVTELQCNSVTVSVRDFSPLKFAMYRYINIRLKSLTLFKSCTSLLYFLCLICRFLIEDLFSLYFFYFSLMTNIKLLYLPGD